MTTSVLETATTRKRYLKPGRPTPDSPYRLIEQRHLSLEIQINEIAFDEAYRPGSPNCPRSASVRSRMTQGRM